MFYVLFWRRGGVRMQLELDLKLPKVVNPVQVFLFFPFLLLCVKVQKNAVLLKPAQLVSQSHTIGPVNEASRTAFTLPAAFLTAFLDLVWRQPHVWPALEQAVQ